MTIDFPTIDDRLPLYIIRPAQNQIRQYDSLLQQQSIKELALSIKKHGLLQAIIVRPISHGFEIVAGHRRFYACKSLHWKVITAMVKDLSDKDAFEIQLVENVHRNTLDPIEEAQAFKRYVIDYGWGGITHLAHAIMKSEQYVSSRLQLLKLPQNVMDRIKSGELNVSHAIELLGLDSTSREAMAENIISKSISIRDIRRYKHQLSSAEYKATLEEYHNAEAEHTISDKDYSNYGKLFPKNNSKHSYALKLLQHKIVFLKKVQLSLKASLSRADSLIHEYEELMAREMKSYGSNDKDPKIPVESYDDEIPEMLMRFRRDIHSMLDYTIHLSSQLAKEESSSQ
jgi:ParB family transcriptional regulator, chromosome partitioning protein